MAKQNFSVNTIAAAKKVGRDLLAGKKVSTARLVGAVLAFFRENQNLSMRCRFLKEANDTLTAASFR